MCRRGQENLYEMTKDWFKVEVSDGKKLLIQVLDELDKNHSEDDSDFINKGKMYEVPGTTNIIYSSKNNKT